MIRRHRSGRPRSRPRRCTSGILQTVVSEGTAHCAVAHVRCRRRRTPSRRSGTRDARRQVPPVLVSMCRRSLGRRTWRTDRRIRCCSTRRRRRTPSCTGSTEVQAVSIGELRHDALSGVAVVSCRAVGVAPATGQARCVATNVPAAIRRRAAICTVRAGATISAETLPGRAAGAPEPEHVVEASQYVHCGYP